MTQNSSLRLRRDVVKTIRAGHPWVYAEALVPPPDDLPAGSPVAILDFAGRFLARGLWDPDSPIAVRVFTREPDEAIDEALVRRRVQVAAAQRASLLADGTTTACRLVHGEADLLPGIVCDRYDDTAVLRFDGDAAGSLRSAAVAAVAALPGIRSILERPFSRAPARSAAAGSPAVQLAGPPPAVPLLVRENCLLFEVDVLHGHKTGLYLDQRDNRALVRSLARGRRLLDLFAYTGGFTVAAAAGGALESLSIDVSRPAIAAARRNAALDGLDPAAHEFLAQDVFAWLESERASRRTFDLLVVDPPSFAQKRAAVPSALRSYRRLNAAVLRRAAPRALVLACSCSSHVDEPTFRRTILAAAHDAGRTVRVAESRGAAPDHPVVPFFPEGRYLKALLLEVR
jgi:23S rRNA (cytosine1962-C5)-methyltransferase